MTTHEWREANDEGEMIYYRVNHHAGRWTFFMRPRDEPNWIACPAPTYALLVSFREILWNKIQRRRAPQKHLGEIDQMIRAVQPATAAAEEE